MYSYRKKIEVVCTVTVKSIDTRKVYRWLLIVSFEQYAAYSVSVSAVDILFASNISMIKQESSWQRVRY